MPPSANDTSITILTRTMHIGVLYIFYTSVSNLMAIPFVLYVNIFPHNHNLSMLIQCHMLVLKQQLELTS